MNGTFDISGLQAFLTPGAFFFWKLLTLVRRNVLVQLFTAPRVQGGGLENLVPGQNAGKNP
jgi:hypothetical protein